MTGLRILVVEDNLDSQYLVCEMLGVFGHETAGVTHAEDALPMLESGHWQVLFSDVSLPGMSGVELARRALRSQPGLHIIFATGYDHSLLEQVEFPHTALQKPYDLDLLQAQLQQIAAALHP
jgi:CheY-like chemotaxis protein